MRNTIKLTEEQEKELVQLYNEGTKITDLCKKYGWKSRNHRSCINILQKHNVEIRKDDITCKVKYTIDIDFFKKINSREKAYILGLIYADGSLSLAKNEMKLALQEDDKHILEEINTIMNSSKPLRYVPMKHRKITYKDQYSLVIERKSIIEDLFKLGVIPNKSSLNLQFPNISILKEEYYPDFIRGYFDGDGCITYNIAKKYPDKKNPAVSFQGSPAFLDQILIIFNNKLGLNINKKSFKSEGDVSCSISYGGINVCTKIYDYFYNNCTLKLNRKFNKFIQLLNKH